MLGRRSKSSSKPQDGAEPAAQRRKQVCLQSGSLQQSDIDFLDHQELCVQPPAVVQEHMLGLSICRVPDTLECNRTLITCLLTLQSALLGHTGLSALQVPRQAGKQEEEVYCVCGQPDDTERAFVECEACERWFHPECVGTTLQVGPACFVA